MDLFHVSSLTFQLFNSLILLEMLYLEFFQPIYAIHLPLLKNFTLAWIQSLDKYQTPSQIALNSQNSHLVITNSVVIPTDLGNLSLLKSIRLFGNNLTNAPSSPNMGFLTSLSNCRSLTYLSISDNPLYRSFHLWSGIYLPRSDDSLPAVTN